MEKPSFFRLHPKHLAYCSVLNSGYNLVETRKIYDLSKSVNEFRNIFEIKKRQKLNKNASKFLNKTLTFRP